MTGRIDYEAALGGGVRSQTKDRRSRIRDRSEDSEGRGPVKLTLKFDLRAPAELGSTIADTYTACLDICSWADDNGFDTVRLHEHHASSDGYLPTPLTFSAALAARTEHLVLRPSVVVLPLHDPVEIAEQLAVVDNIARGRLLPVFGAGYAPHEFAMFGRSIADRVALLDEGIDVIRRVLAGDTIDFRGRPVTVRPLPYKNRTIPLLLGGSSVRAARQAARIADGFEPTDQALLPAYRRACADLGKEPGWTPGTRHQIRAVHVSEDPERAWARLAAHALHENAWYANLINQSQNSVSYYRQGSEADELRAAGTYQVVTPDECVEIARSLGPDGEFELHPLVGGAPADLAWESLELFATKVVPRIQADMAD